MTAGLLNDSGCGSLIFLASEISSTLATAAVRLVPFFGAIVMGRGSRGEITGRLLEPKWLQLWESMNLYGPMWSILVLACWAAVSGSAPCNLIGDLRDPAGYADPTRVQKIRNRQKMAGRIWGPTNMGKSFLLSVTPTCDRSLFAARWMWSLPFLAAEPAMQPWLTGPELTHDVSIPFRVTFICWIDLLAQNIRTQHDITP